MDFGPFSGKHVIIGGLIIVVTCVAMFFLKGILGFGIVLPLWILVSVVITIIVIFAILILTILEYLRWGAEGFLFARMEKLLVHRKEPWNDVLTRLLDFYEDNHK